MVLEERNDANHGQVTAVPVDPFADPMVIDDTARSTQPQVIEEPAPTYDDASQPIVRKYEDYKWSVYLYELSPINDFQHAQPWLQQLVAKTLQSEYLPRCFSHSTRGFIKDGNALSVLVMYNATNPFKYLPAPEFTTTIGVYGYHWYEHDEIHWTTLASDQRQLFAHLVQAGLIVEKHKWTVDADKATEKRFHRAYWLAANLRDLKGLLNRSESHDLPQDYVQEQSADDPDADFSISEAELTNEWDVTEAASGAAWQEILDQVEELGDAWKVSGGWPQHVTTAELE